MKKSILKSILKVKCECEAHIKSLGDSHPKIGSKYDLLKRKFLA